MEKNSSKDEIKTFSFENSTMPYQLDIDKIPEDPLSKSQGNDPSFTKDVQQAAEEGDSTTKNSKKDSEPETKEKEKEKKSNNFY